MLRVGLTGTVWALSFALALATAVSALVVPARAAGAEADDVSMLVAERATQLLVEGDFEGLRSLLAPPIQEQVTAEQLAEGVRQFGPVRSVAGPAMLPRGANDAVAVVHFDAITLDLLIAVEPSGALVGFQLVPHNEANLGGLELEPRPVGDDGADVNVEAGDRGLAAYEAPPYADEEAFAERDVTFGVQGWELPGTYSYPVDADRFPAVVLVHGSGPHDRDESLGANRPFRDLAWGLASRGIAVLRYDKRTLVHQSALDASRITPEQEVIDDSVAAVRWLKAQPGVGPVYVIGHSLGGTLAPAIAERAGADVSGIVSLAGAARPLEELIVEQTEYLAELDGEVSEAERRQVDELKGAVEALTSGAFPDEAMLMGAPAGYYRALGQLLPAPIARRLDIPMLLLQGGRDYQVTSTDFSVWREALAGRENVTFTWFPALNHLFMPGGTPPGPDDYLEPGHVAPGVIDAIASFVHESD